MSISNSLTRLLRYGFPEKRPQRPLLVIFHITTRCDMACRHCADDVWGDPRNDLTMREITRFSEGLGQVESLALGGGEPFLRSDLARICQIFSRDNGVKSISIPTNGFAPTSILAATNAILTACPELRLNVMLSLDGFQETHDAIRRSGSFNRVLETAAALKTLSGRYPRLSLSFNATVCNKNHGELPSLARFVSHEFGARLEFNVIAGAPRDPALAPPGAADLVRALRGIMAASGSSLPKKLYQAVYRDLLVRTASARDQVVPCRAGSLVCLVDANGDVRACPQLPPMGNLRQQSFDEIWNGEEARRQVRMIGNGGCFCTNDCFIRLSLMHYWKLPLMMLGRVLAPARPRAGE